MIVKLSQFYILLKNSNYFLKTVQKALAFHLLLKKSNTTFLDWLFRKNYKIQ